MERASPPSGYSGTPLPVKLGIRPGQAVAVLGGPAGFAESLAAQAGVEIHPGLDGCRAVRRDRVLLAVARRPGVRAG